VSLKSHLSYGMYAIDNLEISGIRIESKSMLRFREVETKVFYWLPFAKPSIWRSWCEHSIWINDKSIRYIYM